MQRCNAPIVHEQQLKVADVVHHKLSEACGDAADTVSGLANHKGVGRHNSRYNCQAGHWSG